MAYNDIFHWWLGNFVDKQEPLPELDCILVTNYDSSTKVWVCNQGGNAPKLQYSRDGYLWIDLPTTAATAVPVQGKNDDFFVICGTNADGVSHSSTKYSSLVFTGDVDVHLSGNINSLVGEKITSIPNDYCFYKLFSYASNKISDVSLLKVKSDVGRDYAFAYAFSGLTSIKATPVFEDLSAVGKYEFFNAFKGCTALTTASVLPATILAEGCYEGMFQDCTGLISACLLPATKLANACYKSMFEGCKTLLSSSYLPATTLAVDCYNSMFKDCWCLVNAPELPALHLVEGCYKSMYENCYNLSSRWSGLTFNASVKSTIGIKLVGSNSGWSHIRYSLDDGNTWHDYQLKSTTPDMITVSKNKSIRWRGVKSNVGQSDDSYIQFVMTGSFSAEGDISSMLNTVGHETNLSYYGDGVFYSLFKDCSSLVKAPLLNATILGKNCYNSLFDGCVNLRTAPNLPAENAAEGCYLSMFKGCTKLTA